MTPEQAEKNLIYTYELLRLENHKRFALLNAIVNGEYEEIVNPPEGSTLHPEYGKEFISDSVKPSDIKY